MKRVVINILFLAVYLLVGCETYTEGYSRGEMLVVSTENIELSSEGGVVEIDVKALCPWDVTSDEDWTWVHSSLKSGEKGSSKIKLTFDQNRKTQKRESVVTIGNDKYDVSHDIIIQQEAFVVEFKVNQSRLDFTSDGGSQFVPITANFDYQVETDADWLTIERNTTGISVVASPYEEVTKREAEITIINKEYNISHKIKVVQAAYVVLFNVEPVELSFTSDGGESYVAITANIDYEISENADWLSFEKTENGVKIIALSNDAEQFRTADVTITNEKYNSSQTIKVTQAAFEVVFTWEYTTVSFTSDGGAKTVTITANIDYEVTENVDWLTVEKISTGIKVTALPYVEVNERTADITITNTKYNRTKTINVVQAAFEPVLEIDLHTLDFNSEGGSNFATITSNIDYQVTDDADWLTVVNTSNGIEVMVLSNDEFAERTADIAISNSKYNITRTIEVVQVGFFIETNSGLNMKMVGVQGGTFQMGATSEQGSDAKSDEKPVHSVILDSYYIAECEVTQAQWRAIMGDNPSYYTYSNNYPVECVSWVDAKEFCEKLSQRTGKNYALPTEAQWEFAARGGNKSYGYKYSGSNLIEDVAWCVDNSMSRTSSVKLMLPNELGLYDMSGNVLEWCSDWYGEDYYSSSVQINPTGPSSGSSRVLRGGDYHNPESSCRVSWRGAGSQSKTYPNVGFRIVCLP